MTDQTTDQPTAKEFDAEAFERALLKIADDPELRPIVDELTRGTLLEMFADMFVGSVLTRNHDAATAAFHTLAKILGHDSSTLAAVETTNDGEKTDNDD